MYIPKQKCFFFSYTLILCLPILDGSFKHVLSSTEKPQVGLLVSGKAGLLTTTLCCLVVKLNKQDLFKRKMPFNMNYGSVICCSKYEMWLLNDETNLKKSTLSMKVLYVHLSSF